MKLKVYNIEGKETGSVDVSEELFGVEYNSALIHQIVVAQLANKRQGTKSTLTRTEVRGGGAKPFRQKGTGRARQGSIRAPQWKKGGVVFAPKPRDFSQKINKKMKINAMKSVLSQKVVQEELIVLDAINFEEAKTKYMATALKNLEATKKTLLVLEQDNEIVYRAGKNIEGLTICEAQLLNVYDLVRNGKCFITVAAIKKLEEDNNNECL